jgi:polysaccharide pyruvyl transferase WcaK-like protein/glycosyltransferase involved in cell wall biosynthesis
MPVESPDLSAARHDVLLTFATVSWQKGSAAQVTSLVHELRKVRNDLRFRLLSHCPEFDREPANRLGIDVIDPGFDPEASRNRRSVSMLARRIRSVARNPLRRVIPIHRPRLAEPVAEAYADSDLMLDLSGDSYRDPPGGFALAHHANLLASLAAGTPYAIVSQSLGPFRAPNRPLARYLLDRACLLYVRERRTRDILVRLGIRSDHIEIAPDIAFALPAESPEPIWRAESLDPGQLPRPWVALSVSDLALRLAAGHGGNAYLAEMASLSRHLWSRYRASVILVPHEINPSYYGSDDRSAAAALFDALGKPRWMRPIQGDYSATRLKGLIGECDALVAARMHAGIAGLSSGVPTVLVAWSHKYRGVMEEIGLSDCVWDQAEESGALDTLFDRLWERRDVLRKQLLAYTARAGREIAKMTARIAGFLPGSSAVAADPSDQARVPDVPSPAVSASALDEDLPHVSIIMPIYNEAAWIARSLTSVLEQDYPKDRVEILIADSRSDDGTAEIIRRLTARYPDRRVHVFENPDRTAGAALNLMVRRAQGDIVVRVDGHAEIAPDYVRSCVAALQKTDALNVGGCVKASGHGILGRTIAVAIGSFWGNGGARYRCPPSSHPEYVDTVQFGAWRRETLFRMGPFEEWIVNEDCEFNARIRHAGGRILLHPGIRAVYFPRSSLRALAKQYFRYGKWKCRVIARHPRQCRARQIAPVMLALALVVPLPIVLGGLDPLFLLSIPAAYSCGVGLVSLHIAARSARPAALWMLPVVLATLHLSYGFGTLLGIGHLFRRRRARPRPTLGPLTRRSAKSRMA